MKRLIAIMKKEFFHIWRDPRTLMLIIALPAVLLILLGYGISGDSLNTPMAIADFSKSDASRAFIDRFIVNQDFELLFDVDSESELINLIDRDMVDVGLIIPEDFGRMIDTNHQASVQIFVDGAMNPSDAMSVQLKLSAINQMASQDILYERLIKSGGVFKLELPISDTIQTLYNPTGDQSLYMIPGLIPILLQVQTLLLSTLAIVREREQGTMEQLIVTPIKGWELMLGKIIPYLLVSILNLFVLLWLGDILFGVSVAGSFWDFVLLSIVFNIGSLGMGVLISNISQSQMQAIYIAVFIVLIPAIILSGLLYTRDNMPAVTHWYSELLPVTHYLEISRGIIVRGAEAATLLWTSTLPLVVLSVVYFGASILVFKKRL